MEFKVDIDVFSGPMDLLLYLVKRHEVDVTQVPIAKLAEEFVAHLQVLESLEIDEVGEFIDLASVLLEIKARALLPTPTEEEGEQAVEEAREDLVKRLLEYKQYRDAATALEDRARQWELRFPRRTAEPVAAGVPQEVTIADVHVWDLVGAMSRVMKRRQKAQPRTIQHDDTPIEVHVERVRNLVNERQRLAFFELFDDQMPRTRVVGIFLAVLELVRRREVAARQEQLFGEIWLSPAATMPADDEAPVVHRFPGTPAPDASS